MYGDELSYSVDDAGVATKDQMGRGGARVRVARLVSRPACRASSIANAGAAPDEPGV